MRFLVLAGVYLACVAACMSIWWLVTSPGDRKDSLKFVIIGAVVVTYVVGNIVDRKLFKRR